MTQELDFFLEGWLCAIVFLDTLTKNVKNKNHNVKEIVHLFNKGLLFKEDWQDRGTSGANQICIWGQLFIDNY